MADVGTITMLEGQYIGLRSSLNTLKDQRSTYESKKEILETELENIKITICNLENIQSDLEKYDITRGDTWRGTKCDDALDAKKTRLKAWGEFILNCDTLKGEIETAINNADNEITGIIIKSNSILEQMSDVRRKMNS